MARAVWVAVGVLAIGVAGLIAGAAGGHRPTPAPEPDWLTDLIHGGQ